MQLYQNQEKVAEHIAAEGGKDAVGKVGLASAEHDCFALHVPSTIRYQ